MHVYNKYIACSGYIAVIFFLLLGAKFNCGSTLNFEVMLKKNFANKIIFYTNENYTKTVL